MGRKKSPHEWHVSKDWYPVKIDEYDLLWKEEYCSKCGMLRFPQMKALGEKRGTVRVLYWQMIPDMIWWPEGEKEYWYYWDVSEPLCIKCITPDSQESTTDAMNAME